MFRIKRVVLGINLSADADGGLFAGRSIKRSIKRFEKREISPFSTIQILIYTSYKKIITRFVLCL